MSSKCQQCGDVAERAMNFCRKCGAPLAAEPIAGGQEPVTRPLENFATSHLPAQVPTTAIKPAVASPEPVDLLNTLEPAKSAVGTEVLTTQPGVETPSSPAITPAPAAVSAPLPAPAPATVGTAPRTNRNLGMLAVAAIAVCALIGGAAYWMRANNSSTTIANASPVQPVATPPTENAAAPGNASVTPVTESSPLTANPVVAKPSPTATNKAATAKSGQEADAQPLTATSGKGDPKSEMPANPAPAESNANYVAQGNSFLSAKQFGEAIAAYQKAQRADPSNQDLHYLLGSAYHQMGQLEQALAQYQQCKSGSYASVAANHVRNLEKKLGKVR